MTTTTKILLVPVFAALIAVLGVGAAVASEIGGTIGQNGGNEAPSYTDGGLVATVGESPSPSGQSSSSSGSNSSSDSRTGGRSDVRSGSRASSGSSGDDVIIILDDGSAAQASSGFAGTGGGYDPELEAALADGSDNTITPGEAVAFNTANNPLANTDLIAASGETGIESAKVWTAIVLGLALLGLAGYAVNALIAYRRENDL